MISPNTRAFVLLLLLVSAGGWGCNKKLAELYCEGGVVNGKSNGGDCIRFEAAPAAASRDPDAIIGKVYVQGSYIGQNVRRASSTRFTLHEENDDKPVIGEIIQTSGDWITITFKAHPYKKTMRSDGPGLFQ